MKHSVRNWHNWVSIALGVPLLLVGLTTFFIAHEKSLGTKEITIALAAAGPKKTGPALEIRASNQIGSEQWIATQQGLFRLDGARASGIDGAPKDEIRAMAQLGQTVFLAGKKGLWRYEGGKASLVHQADCWQVVANERGLTAACKDDGLLESVDGKQWRERAVAFPAEVVATANKGTPLSKLVLDIHTGKLFFGKQFEWIWIDLLGLACVGLGITGLVMWMRGRKQRALSAA